MIEEQVIRGIRFDNNKINRDNLAVGITADRCYQRYHSFGVNNVSLEADQQCTYRSQLVICQLKILESSVM